MSSDDRKGGTAVRLPNSAVTLTRVLRHRFSILERCNLTPSTRSRPELVEGRLPAFLLFENQLSRMDNGLCEIRVDSVGVAHGLDGRPWLTPLDRRTTHIHTPYVIRCARISRAARSPLAMAPWTVPVWPLVSVASPAKKSVSSSGSPSRRGASAPPTQM